MGIVTWGGMRENWEEKRKRRKYCRVLCLIICGWCVVTVKDSNTASCLLAPCFSSFLNIHLSLCPSLLYHLFSFLPSINEGTWIVKGAEASISQRINMNLSSCYDFLLVSSLYLSLSTSRPSSFLLSHFTVVHSHPTHFKPHQEQGRDRVDSW